ncbi:YkvA family protein [Pseudomarimonas salicorniae]|uniref:YkvA family protein n=1 Tax=Pseudomarimonas salicorniae TaxID=2933270 RepID=A0ABT0GDK6_9GAMM|nr:YkvA family protein [Lysobacter sp. CAU 1642]MCK7592630.1 YkvA family protein [Lysobacter sp. CAU 1642]
MSLAIHVTMNEASLAPFRTAWIEAIAGVGESENGALVEAARRHVGEARQRRLPPFLQSHVDSIDDLIRMLADRSWPLPTGIRRDLEGALAYFVDEKDLIPDDNPKFGLLDDAIVLELALSSHEHEWLAWREYDRFRRDYPELGPLDRGSWMSLRRNELDAALRHRRRMQQPGRQRYSVRPDLVPFNVN